MKLTLRHLDWLQVQTSERCSMGYNQEWYGTDWQRLAGCGPTTATQVLNYIMFRDGRLAPSQFKQQATALLAMERVFSYVRPRRGGGLYKTRWMKEGLDAIFADEDLPYEAKMLRIYPFKMLRPKIEEVVGFILNAIVEDCPIAFLNRHKGQESGLDTWHWVPIVALERQDDEFIASVYDAEQIRKFSVNRWLNDTVFGGGFVYVTDRK